GLNTVRASCVQPTQLLGDSSALPGDADEPQFIFLATHHRSARRGRGLLLEVVEQQQRWLGWRRQLDRGLERRRKLHGRRVRWLPVDDDEGSRWLRWIRPDHGFSGRGS